MSSRLIRNACFLILAFVCARGLSAAALRQEVPAGWETGLPFGRTFNAKEYDGGSQNWDIARGPTGLIYVANTNGVLEFDGQRWRTIPLPGGKSAHSLTVDAEGKVFVGASGELGYLAPDAQGQFRYVSLLDRLSPEDRVFSGLWRAHTGRDGVYFCCYERLFRVRDGQVKAWKSTTSFRRSFWVAGQLYVREASHGLLRLDQETLRPVPGGEAFSELSISSMVPGPSKDALLIGTLDQGLWMLKDGHAAPYESTSNAFLRTNKLQCGVVLPDGLLALGTFRAGVVLLDRDGRTSFQFGQASGLLPDDVKAILPTPEGHLWIVQSRGLCRMQWPWPISSFDARNGLNGSVLSAVRHHGELYVGTSLGVFLLQPTRSEPSEMPGVFRKVEGIESQTWDLLSIGDEMLAANHWGVYSITGTRAHRIATTPFSVGFLLPSRRDPGVVYLGMENGLGLLRRKGAGWVNEGLQVTMSGDVQRLLEAPDGRLWAGTAKNGLWRITLGEGHAASAERILGEVPERADCTPFEWGGRTALLASGSLYLLDQDAFHRFQPLHALLGDRRIEVAAPGPQGELWLECVDPSRNTFEECVVQRDAQGNFTLRSLPRAAEFTTVANVLHAEEGGITWVGHFQGLYRLNARTRGIKSEPLALVRKVASLKGDLVFGGSAEAVSVPVMGKVELPFEHHGLRFEFAAPGFPQPANVRFRVRMEGNDAEWSPWMVESYRDYTNLPEGNYVFHIEAQDGEGRRSREGLFRMTIRPPWYRTWWMRVTELALIAACVYGLHRLRIRMLWQRNQELEARIHEATRELREREARLAAQAEDLQIANHELQILDEQKNTFLGVVAHDLKGPLHGIVLAAEAFERDPKEAIRARGQAIRKEGTDMCALIDRFLNVAAMESGELTARFEQVDVVSFVKAVVTARSARAEEKGIEVTLQAPTGPLHMLGDGMYLREILDNLLTNALKFSPRESRVDLRVEAGETWIRISVEDQGPGLSELDMRKVFGRFTRLSARPTGGESSSGLGLFIAKRMVDDLGGRIWVESERGKGAAFRVEFPRSAELVAPTDKGGD